MKVKLEVFSGIVEIQITDVSIQGCIFPPPAPHRVCPLVTLGMGCHPDRLCLPSERPLPPNPSFLFLLLSPPRFLPVVKLPCVFLSTKWSTPAQPGEGVGGRRGSGRDHGRSDRSSAALPGLALERQGEMVWGEAAAGQEEATQGFIQWESWGRGCAWTLSAWVRF